MIETSKSKVGYLALSLALGGAMAAGAAYGVDAMYVDTAGNVGIGTSTPDTLLELKGNAPDLRLSDTGGFHGAWTVGVQHNTGKLQWSDDSSGSRIPLTLARNAVSDLLSIGVTASDRINIAGNVVMTGTLTTGGPTCSGGCDLVLSPGYQLDSIEAHAAKMWAESYLPAVGPTPEGGAGFNLTEKTGGILSELEKAHIYIEQINDQVKTLTAENRGQQQTIQALREELREQDAAQAALMARLEQRLAVLEASGHRGSQ